jgi:hypothetical protein
MGHRATSRSLWSVVRIPPLLRGSVDFCSFEQVFSHDPRCWACGNCRGYHITLFLGENDLGMKLCLHQFGDGICGLV